MIFKIVSSAQIWYRFHVILSNFMVFTAAGNRVLPDLVCNTVDSSIIRPLLPMVQFYICFE